MNRLVNLLIVKSVLDTVLVATIAVVVYLNAFPPTFHGWGEVVVGEQAISGWAVNNADPSSAVEVQLFIDGRFENNQLAVETRPDVVAAGWAKEPWRGYTFYGPKLPPGVHEARVYALHPCGKGARYTLQLLGDPIRFRVKPDGSWTTDTHR